MTQAALPVPCGLIRRILPVPAMRLSLLPITLCMLSIATSAFAQETAGAAGEAALHDYESCSFPDGLQVVKVDALPPGIQQRSVNTSSGPKTLRMLAGRRIMLAYAMGDFVANVKPELLPDDTWGVEKQTLLDELDFLLASDHANVPNTALPPQMHGLEIRGFDRATLTGSVLGFYLFFDNTRHIATSVSLLNQDPLTRKFQTLAQYRALREQFLTTYAGCIQQNQALDRTAQGTPPATTRKDGR